MKKIALVFTILVVLLLTACNAESQSTEHMAPPQPSEMIVFKSEEELQALLGAAALPDAEFNAFMTQNADVSSYQVIEDKSVAAELSMLIQTVGTPVLSKKSLLENYAFTYRPTERVYDVKYYINGMRYRFVYAPFDTFSDVSDMVPIASYDLDGAPLTMYQLEDDNVGNKRMLGEVYANGYRIRVVVNYTDIDAIDFTLFSWSTDMQYMK